MAGRLVKTAALQQEVERCGPHRAAAGAAMGSSAGDPADRGHRAGGGHVVATAPPRLCWLKEVAMPADRWPDA